jgi:hypothetical protein
MKNRYIWNKLVSKLTQYSQVYKDLIEKSDHSKSTILKPLAWLLGICIALFTSSYSLKADKWISITIAAITLFIIALYLIIYVHSYFKNPDLLRSEKYTLTKMAIEKSFQGDSLIGLVKDDGSLTQRKVEG